VLNTLQSRADAKSEEAADRKGVELLKNSPYNDKLATAGLFLRALSVQAKDTPNLLGAQLGAKLVESKHLMRMADLMATAPELKPRELTQIAALPLGSRIKLNSWSGQVDLMKNKPVALTAAREKMPFQLTHFYPYLTREANSTAEKTIGSGTLTAARAAE
jgi:hypothetical protein